jgi:hypothetical protein
MIIKFVRINGLKFHIKGYDGEFKFASRYDKFSIDNAYHNVLSNSERDEVSTRNSYAFCGKVCEKSKKMEVRPYTFKTTQVNEIKKITLSELPHWKSNFEAWSNEKKRYLILVNSCNELSRVSFDDFVRGKIKIPSLISKNFSYNEMLNSSYAIQKSIKNLKERLQSMISQ